MVEGLLKRVPLFANLVDEELEALAQATLLRTFSKNAMIIWAEDEGDSFFVIQSGQVKVSVMGRDGREIILSTLGPSEFFGDMSLLDGHPRSANVTALQETEALVIRRADFHRALQRYPSIGVHMLVTLASRLRAADYQTATLALLGIADRISTVLLSIADEEGVETEEGVVIRRRPTHQIIANLTGTARETVTRVMGRLSDAGYIRSEGRELVILKQDEILDA